jgi:hypothetical protein
VELHPTHGFTKRGHAVHGKTMDHMPTDTAYQRFCQTIAVRVTRNVGTMTCAFVFALIAFVGLPAALGLTLVPSRAGNVVLWVSSEFIQLVLLSIIMVGQDVAAKASDARTALSFEHLEFVKNQVDETTDGGLKKILDAIEALKPAT